MEVIGANKNCGFVYRKNIYDQVVRIPACLAFIDKYITGFRDNTVRYEIPYREMVDKNILKQLYDVFINNKNLTSKAMYISHTKGSEIDKSNSIRIENEEEIADKGLIHRMYSRTPYILEVKFLNKHLANQLTPS